MNSMIENVLANLWVIVLVFNKSIINSLDFVNVIVAQYIIWFLIAGSLTYAIFLYRKRWDELKINRPDLFMMVEERKKAMQESRGKK